jgi:hypothetical protein
MKEFKMAKKKQTEDADTVAGNAANDTIAGAANDTIAQDQAPAIERRYQVSRPPMINGHIAGLNIRNGCCITEDPVKAAEAQKLGATVTAFDECLPSADWPRLTAIAQRCASFNG